jgi:hypothetical protein
MGISAYATTNGLLSIAEDVPLELAWIDARRIYIDAPYRSNLNESLRAIGAKWDGEIRALWVGKGKRPIVEVAVRAHIDAAPARQQAAADKRATTAQTVAAGHLVAIPYEYTQLREEAKEHGAVWVPDRKMWAMPTADLAERAAAAADRWQAKRPVRSSQKCDECDRPGARHHRTDSSGIAGVVCNTCSALPSAELSFA